MTPVVKSHRAWGQSLYLAQEHRRVFRSLNFRLLAYWKKKLSGIPLRRKTSHRCILPWPHLLIPQEDQSPSALLGTSCRDGPAKTIVQQALGIKHPSESKGAFGRLWLHDCRMPARCVQHTRRSHSLTLMSFCHLHYRGKFCSNMTLWPMHAQLYPFCCLIRFTSEVAAFPGQVTWFPFSLESTRGIFSWSYTSKSWPWFHK